MALSPIVWQSLYQLRYPDAFILEIKANAFMKDWYVFCDNISLLSRCLLSRYNIFKFVFELKSAQQKRSSSTRNTVTLDLGQDYLKAAYNGKKNSYVCSKCNIF